jgi:hypothetical protein
MARNSTGTVFWIAMLTVTGIGAETGFFDFSEQAEENTWRRAATLKFL